MEPVQLAHTIYQGATFDDGNVYGTVPYPVRVECGQLVRRDTGEPVPPSDFVPRDFTGCTARMQLRREVGSPEPLESFTSDDGSIVFDGAGGVFFNLDAARTAAMKYGNDERAKQWATAVGHLEIVHANGKVERLAEIAWTLSPEGTR